MVSNNNMTITIANMKGARRTLMEDKEHSHNMKITKDIKDTKTDSIRICYKILIALQITSTTLLLISKCQTSQTNSLVMDIHATEVLNNNLTNNNSFNNSSTCTLNMKCSQACTLDLLKNQSH